MTVGEAQATGQRLLGAAGIESKHIDTALLLEKVTGRPRSWLFAHLEEPLQDDQARAFLDYINRRRQRTPLVHLTNRREFYGIELYIDERVLTPRVETEKMVDYALRYAPKYSRLIDLGTGSGALAVAIKKHRPDLEVWATDVSVEALEVAKLNADRVKVLINFLTSDLLEKVSGRFATVVTNLPYLKDDAELMPEVQQEPAIALLGGADGLELYRQLLLQLPNHLEPGGYLFTECDPWQHESLIQAASTIGLKPIEPSDYFVLGFQAA